MTAALPENARLKTTSYDLPAAGDFAFSEENRARVETIVARYPEGRQASAVIPLLDIAQRQNGGWLSPAAIEHVAAVLAMAPIRVYEVVSFYTMFYDRPVGDHLVQVCRTTPCWLRGSDALTEACLKKLGVGMGEVTADGKFSVTEVECLGACANAPMVQINDEYYEDLTPERMVEILDALAAGKPVGPGPQTGRIGSAPEGGPATLREVPPREAVDPKETSAKERSTGESLSDRKKASELGGDKPTQKRDKAQEAALDEDRPEATTTKNGEQPKAEKTPDEERAADKGKAAHREKDS